MSKAICVVCAVAIMAASSGPAVLPDISGLPELKLELVADFSDHPKAGLPWVGRIGGGEFVFFDVKLKQVLRMPLAGGEVLGIGSPGEGPGEYQGVQDIWLDGEIVYVLDGRGRIIAFRRDGKVTKDMKPPRRFERFVGRRGDVFYLEGRNTSPEAYFENVVASWREGGPAAMLLKSAADVMTTKASDLAGKQMASGHFTLSEPAFAMFGDRIIEASGNRYRLRFFDRSGRAAETWDVRAPEPEFAGQMYKSFNGKRSAYAVRAIFPGISGLAVVGNYYRNGKPRLDCFDSQGRVMKSYLIPLAWEAPFSRCQIEGEYLIYFSSQEGCRVYRLLSPLL
jgi:hypothetical protein